MATFSATGQFDQPNDLDFFRIDLIAGQRYLFSSTRVGTGSLQPGTLTLYDPVGDVDTSIYLYRLPSETREDAELVQVYTPERTGPRDVLPLPDWGAGGPATCFAALTSSTHAVATLSAPASVV